MKESVTSNQSTCNSPKANSYNPEFMKEAIRIAVENVENGTGGPFGAVVVRDGKIIATSGNTVVPDNDPTAHAEVNAIRKACKQLDSFQLKGCEIYSSCEPCPMCLGAIYWARPERVYYACTKEDAAVGGFDDSFIYDELAVPRAERCLKTEALLRDEAIEAFRLWMNTEDKTEY